MKTRIFGTGIIEPVLSNSGRKREKIPVKDLKRSIKGWQPFCENIVRKGQINLVSAKQKIQVIPQSAIHFNKGQVQQFVPGIPVRPSKNAPNELRSGSRLSKDSN